MFDKITCAVMGVGVYRHIIENNFDFWYWLMLVVLLATILMNDEKEY